MFEKVFSIKTSTQFITALKNKRVRERKKEYKNERNKKIKYNI